MNKHYWAFWYALALLSRVPTPFLKRTDKTVADASIFYYPIVGLVLGALLAGFVALVLSYNAAASLWLVSALVLAMWVWFTGALHLDGLADTADAWVGGLGNKERTLAIMKDPQSGPMGVTAIVVILLIKCAAIYALLDQVINPISWDVATLVAGLILVPMLARAGILSLMGSMTYVRSQGMVSAVNNSAGTPRIIGIFSALILAALLLLGIKAMVLVLAWFGLLMLLRRAFMQRLGGYTGDTLGASIEIQETLLLTALVLI